MRRLPIVILAAFLTCFAADAVADRYVDVSNLTPATPYATWGDASTNIQNAVNAASSGETVWLAPGTYTVPTNAVDAGGTNVVYIKDKALTLQSSNGDPETTIIDGEGLYRGMYLFPGSHQQIVIDGITVANGWGGSGGGMYMYVWNDATSVVQNCVIRDNTANNGGGVFVGPQDFRRYTYVMSNCVFRGNQATNGRAGDLYSLVRADYAKGIFKSCVVVSNYSSGGAAGFYLSSSPNAELENCVFMYNSSDGRGGGLFLRGDDTTVRNCLFYKNDGDWGGGVYLGKNNVTVFENTTIADNTGGNGSGVSIQEPENTLRFYNTIVYDDGMGTRGTQYITNSCFDPSITHWTNGVNTFTNDPQFVDAANGDFRISRGSPCINTGTNQLWMEGAVDLDGNPRIDRGVVDIGAYEYRTLGTTIMVR